jgi:hypothetical protein
MTAPARAGQASTITTFETTGIYRLTDGSHYVAMAAHQPHSWWLLECMRTEDDWDIGHRQDDEGHTVVWGFAIHRIELITFQTVLLIQQVSLLVKDGIIDKAPLHLHGTSVVESFAADLVGRVKDVYPQGFTPPW